MSEEFTRPAPVKSVLGTAPKPDWPATINVSSFFSASNGQEILLALGRTILRPAPAGDGFEATSDWFNTLSMSPETAFVAWQHLGKQLAMYEARYGEIPKPKETMGGVVDLTHGAAN